MHLEVDITNKCNLSCSYCYHKDYHESRDISTKAIQIVNSIPNVERMTFYGGEPLLNFDAIKQIKKPKRWRIVTNLTTITPEMATYIKVKGGRLQVSLDGVEQAHNKYRGNTYRIVRNNILKYRSIIDNIRMTIMPDTLQYLSDSIKDIASMGVKHVSPVFCREIFDTYDWENYRYQLKDIRNIPIKNKILKDAYRVSTRKQCGAGLGMRFIDVDGNNYVCHRLRIKEPILVTPNRQCSVCICKDICVGTCLYSSYILTGTFNGLSSVFCNYMITTVKELRNGHPL